MVTFCIITAQYQNKEIGFSASVHSQRHSGFLKLTVEESHYHIFKISYRINQVAAGKGPNKEEARPLSKEAVLKASGSIISSTGIREDQFTMRNDMSLFHQQKWCLDKIQLTVAIQLSEFFFFAQ